MYALAEFGSIHQDIDLLFIKDEIKNQNFIAKRIVNPGQIMHLNLSSVEKLIEVYIDGNNDLIKAFFRVIFIKVIWNLELECGFKKRQESLIIC